MEDAAGELQQFDRVHGRMPLQFGDKEETTSPCTLRFSQRLGLEPLSYAGEKWGNLSH